MTGKRIRIYSEYIINMPLETFIERMTTLRDESKARGEENAIVVLNDEKYSEGLEVYARRAESNEERLLREEQERQARESQEASDRATYERLKAKFEPQTNKGTGDAEG